MKNKNNNTLIITRAGLIVLGIIFISATMNKWLSYSLYCDWKLLSSLHIYH
jgi:hypothetical protein